MPAAWGILQATFGTGGLAPGRASFFRLAKIGRDAAESAANRRHTISVARQAISLEKHFRPISYIWIRLTGVRTGSPVPTVAVGTRSATSAKGVRLARVRAQSSM
ncbi:hypothetical protein GCM10023085_65550 [Actinomadura viridis]